MRHAQLATIAALALAVLFGQVTDRTTGQPMPHVKLQLHGSMHVTAITDRSGRYKLNGLRPGVYSVTLSSSDVPPVRTHVHVGVRTTRRNFVVCSTTLDYSCGGGGGSGPG